MVLHIWCGSPATWTWRVRVSAFPSKASTSAPPESICQSGSESPSVPIPLKPTIATPGAPPADGHDRARDGAALVAVAW